jgi:hypothetical protein
VILNGNLPDRSTQFIVNAAGSVLKIYPPTGGSINGLTATTGAWTLGDNQTGIVGRRNATTWFAIGSPAT